MPMLYIPSAGLYPAALLPEKLIQLSLSPGLLVDDGSLQHLEEPGGQLSSGRVELGENLGGSSEGVTGELIELSVDAGFGPGAHLFAQEVQLPGRILVREVLRSPEPALRQRDGVRAVHGFVHHR